MDQFDIYDSDGYQPSVSSESDDYGSDEEEMAIAENVSEKLPKDETKKTNHLTSLPGYEENKSRVKICERFIIPKVMKDGTLKFREFCHVCNDWKLNFSNHFRKTHPRLASESINDFQARKEVAFREMREDKKKARQEYAELVAKQNREDVVVDIDRQLAVFLDAVRDEVMKNFAVVCDLMATMDSYPDKPHEVKALLKRLGLYDMYEDPIIEEYIQYQLNMARRGRDVGNENTPSKELISESNILRHFVDYAEIPLLEYFSIVGRITNSKTITNYQRSIKNFVEFLRVQKLRSGVLDDRNTDQALTMIVHKVEKIVYRIMKNKEKEEEDKIVVVDSRPYPWYSRFIRELDLTVPKDARPEFLYKAELGHVMSVIVPTTGKKWAAFRYSGKSAASHHMLDAESRKSILLPYLEKRKQVVEEHFLKLVAFSVKEKSSLFFNSKDEFWKSNITKRRQLFFSRILALTLKNRRLLTQLRKSEEVFTDDDVSFFKVFFILCSDDEEYGAAKEIGESDSEPDSIACHNDIEADNIHAEPIEVDNNAVNAPVNNIILKSRRKATKRPVAEQVATRDACEIISQINFPRAGLDSLKSGNVYRENMIDRIFSMISYHQHYWKCVNRKFVRKFLRRIPTLAEKYTIIGRFELMRIIGGIFIVLKSKEIKPKKFARDPRSYTNVLLQGLAELGIPGELRADEYLARAAKMIPRIGYYTYEQLE
uniref:Integrase_SAM-like_N domain-containing protein n=1 Tax=Strongyloides venezuelensis TaxID=75913 RepID=A0A0K0FEW2_STRVS